MITKRIFTSFALSLALITGCTPEKEQVTIDGITNAFKEAKLPIGDVESFSKDTDPNEQLGKPGYYSAKADFADNRLDQINEEYTVEKDLIGGKIELFENGVDAKKRYNYLKRLNDPELGPIALDEFLYLHDNILLRITYDLSEEQAQEYNKALNNYLD